MNRWQTKLLSELVLPTEQRDPTQDATVEFSYVDIAAVDNEQKSIVSTKQIIGADAPSRARKVIRKGDVIVSTVRPNLNAVALVPDHLDNQICSTGFSVLRPSDKILKNYLFAFVRSPAFINFLIARTTGANYPAVNDREVKDVPIPVPPLAEQERIVKLLDEADELRKLRAQADRRTANLIPALFHEMFGDADTNPMGWDVVTVGDVVQPIEFGISEALSKGCEFQPGRIAVLRIANITAGGEVDYSDLRYLKVSDKKRNQLLLQEGDLLFNWRNSPNWVGKTAIFDSDEPCIFASFLYRIRVVEDKIDRVFLWFYFNHLRRNGFFESKCRQAVSQANFGRDELAAVRIILPPLHFQKQFAQRVTEIRALEAEQAASRTRLDALFQSMLHRAFNGEL